MSETSSTAWQSRFDLWHAQVQEIIATVDSGASIATGPATQALTPPSGAAAAPPTKVLFCAPHPDDECLSGALALRLRMDSGASVTNIAITLGSDLGQRARRLAELQSACRALGFALVVPIEPATGLPSGFDHLEPERRQTHPAEWQAQVNELALIFKREKPDLILAPHVQDFNTTHVATHMLVTDAMTEYLERSGIPSLPLVETEFWHQIERPNLMVGLTPAIAAMQIVAAAEHGGEMSRNPYHVLHTCRLMDNVRRGSEVVFGQGAAAQPFKLAELYNVRVRKGRQWLPTPPGQAIAPEQPVSVAWIQRHYVFPGA